MLLESLEHRHLLAALVGVDFDNGTGTTPTNWTSVGTQATPFTQSNLIDDTGAATPIDLTISGAGSGITADAATIQPATLLDASLSGLDGFVYTSDVPNQPNPVTLTWSDLQPNTDYEVYVFGLEGSLLSTTEQRVTVTGSTTVSFQQNFERNQLFVNDQLGAAGQPLQSYAKVIQSTSTGQIVVQVDPQRFTLDVSLGGVAIREASVPELNVFVADASVSEGAGTAATTGVVTRNTDPTSDLVVNLTASDPNEATVPATVTIPAGERFVRFNIDTVDDDLPEPNKTVTFTASAAGHNDGAASLDIIDDDTNAFTVTILDAAVLENAGNGATVAIVQRTGDVSLPVTVNWASSNPNKLVAPASITLQAGQLISGEINLDVIDNLLNDGTETVTLSATATGYQSGQADLDVVDDEVANGLVVDVAATAINEGDGAQATTATISRPSSGLIVNRIERSIRTSDGVFGTQENDSRVGGDFTANLRHENPNNSLDTSESDLMSGIDANGLDGAGFANFDTATATLNPIDNRSYYDVYFDLDTSHAFTLNGFVVADADNADASVLLTLTGPNTNFSFSQRANLNTAGGRIDINETGVLEPGTYHLRASAHVFSLGSADQFADAEFSFNIDVAPADLTVALAGDATEVGLPASVVIPAGQTSVTIDVAAVDDTIVDGTQTVAVVASAAGHADGSDVVDVTDNDTVEITLAIAAASIAENNSTTGTVTRTGDLSNALTINLASSDSGEATVPTSVTIPAGQASSPTFPISGVTDNIVDGTQTVTITASATGIGANAKTIDVTDIDVPTLTLVIVGDQISENGGTTTAVVTRNTDPTNAMTVNLASSDTGEANVPATIVIPAGAASSAPFTISGVDDAIVDGTQQVVITASATGMSAGTDSVNVTDDDVAALTLTIAAASMSENGGTTTATVSRNTDPTNALTVNVVSSDTSEATVVATVTIPAGQTTSAPFSINGVDDSIVDGTQTVTLTASAANHLDGVDTVDVTDDDVASLTIVIVADAISENGGVTTATVTRNTGTANALTVNLVSSDTGEATVPATITIPAGQSTSAPFNVTGVDDAVADGTQTVTITAQATGHAAALDTVDVTDDDIAMLTVVIVDASIGENGGATTAVVTRTSNPSASLTVNLSSSDTSEATVPTSVTIPQGSQTSAPFAITAIDDFLIDGTQTVTITASAAAHANGTDTVDVTDDDVAGVVITETDGNTLVFENGTTDTFTVELTAQPAGVVAILVTSGDTGEATVDPATIQFTPNDWNVPKPVTVTGVDDPLTDGDQTSAITVAIDPANSDDAFDALPAQTVSVVTRDVDASITGTVWDDANGDGQQGPGEVVMANVQVYLDLDRSGTWSSGEPITQTGNDGAYRFDNVAAGEYVVAQIVPTGLAQTFPQVIGAAGTFAKFITDLNPSNAPTDFPTHATHAPHDVGRLFVTLKSGRISIIDLNTNTVLPTPFLTVPNVDTFSEGGLTGLAFHPDFANNGKFYVAYTRDNGGVVLNGHTSPFSSVITEYRVSQTDPNVADPTSARDVLSFVQPIEYHNGGWLGFGPDGYLYISSGDGGPQHDTDNNAQSLDTMLGKILRIDVDQVGPGMDYGIPADNPFLNTAGALPEIWSYGLRNPWKASFDGNFLMIGDVGQNSFEEINRSAAGGENYGWRLREGFVATPTGGVGGARPTDNVDPILAYAHGVAADQGNSVVGGYVYRGPVAEFQGQYIFADTVSHNIWSVDPLNPNATPLAQNRINDLLVPDQNQIGDGLFGFDIVSFGEDGSNNLYVIQFDGDIHKVSKRLPGTHLVLAEAGEVVTDVDFGNQDPQASSLGNRVWHDLDGDGQQGQNEPGIDGVTVNLYRDGQATAAATTTTAGGGLYRFDQLPAGQYVIEFVAPTGWLFSPPNQTIDTLDSDANRTTGRTGVITLAPSSTDDSIDAGMYQQAVISDAVWDDLNGNGVQDTGEPPLAGVAVDLIGRIDDFQDQTTQGWIKHSNPSHPVQPFNVPDGGPNGTGDAFLRSNSTGAIQGAGGRMVIRNVSQWTGDLSGIQMFESDVKNFGTTELKLRLAINGPGGWFATSNAAAVVLPAGADWTHVSWLISPNTFSPVQGATDFAATLANVTELRLLSSQQPDFKGEAIAGAMGVDNFLSVEQKTETSGNGFYAFDVEPGAYHVRFHAPASRVISPQHVGNDPLIDSDPDPASGITSQVVVTSGQVDKSVDAGMILPTLTLTIAADSISENGGTTTAVVSRNTDPTNALDVLLFSSDTSEATVPLTVTIPAGAVNSAPFAINAVDDAIVDGTQVVAIEAEAAGHVGGRDTLAVTDDDTPELSIVINADQISENGGQTAAIVTRNDSNLDQPLEVTLVANPADEVRLAQTITIPAGARGVSTPIFGVDDAIVDGDQVVAVSASAVGYVEGIDRLIVTDDDVLTLTLQIAAAEIGENGGSTTATLTRNDGNLANPLVVTLLAGPADEVTLPSSVTIAAGASSAEFTITGQDDLAVDGTQTVVVKASAPGYVGAEDAVDVLDDDVPGFMVVETASGGSTRVSESGLTDDFFVVLTAAPMSDVVFDISVGDPTEAAVNLTRLTFTPDNWDQRQRVIVSGPDDDIADGEQRSEITVAVNAAQSDNAFDDLAPQSIVVITEDNDVATLTVQLRSNVINEGQGAGATTAIVTRNTPTDQPLVVTMSSSDTTEAQVQETVTIPAGQFSSAPFNIDAVDDAIIDGTQTVTIQAAAPGHQSGSAALDVQDNDQTVLKITSLEISATRDHKGLPGKDVVIEGTFDGASDNVVATVDWGDGSPAATVDVTNGAFRGVYRYSSGGIFEVTVTLSDGGNTVTDGIQAFVSGIRLTDDGTLQIIGTKDRDRIYVYQRRDEIRVRMRLGRQRWTRFRAEVDQIKRMHLVLCDSNDLVRFTHGVKIPAVIEADAGNDFIRTGSGDVTVLGGGGHDVIMTGRGNDTVIDLEGNNSIRTGSGDDHVETGEGADRIVTAGGDDVITDHGGLNLIYSGRGDDEVKTGDGRDIIVTSSGDDVVHSGGSGDVVFSGSGNDTLFLGAGIDYAHAGSGHDYVDGGDDSDVIIGAAGHDILLGQQGSDRLFGSSGRDLIIGGLGRDTLLGGNQDDLIIAGTTDHDTNDVALRALLAEWKSSKPYQDRVANIQSGVGGFALNSSTAHNDSDSDSSWGGRGRDWFFANLQADPGGDPLDRLRDKRSNELVEELS